MVRLLHLLIIALYISLPVLWVGRLLLARRRDQRTAERTSSLLVTLLAGLAVAVAMCLFHARALEAHVPVRQIALAAYFATSMLLLLRCFDVALLWSLRRAVGLRGPGHASFGRALRHLLVLSARTAILFAVGLPWVLAAGLVYRPGVESTDPPAFPHERVEIETRDGLRLSGLWLPAEAYPGAQSWDQSGRQTVILCPGLSARQAQRRLLARTLVPAGFNVLLLDLRTFGNSGGRLSGYGALEKRDVLAAVKWLRDERPAHARKIFGVGSTIGASALIGAAADDSAEGRAIDALAAYTAWDNLPAMVDDLSFYWARQPVRFLAQRLLLPLASLHAGVNLSADGPDRAVKRIWPRPLLFIHGQMDDFVPFDRGLALFEAADQPKYHVWYSEASHRQVLTDESAARIVVEFFKSARPAPVI